MLPNSAYQVTGLVSPAATSGAIELNCAQGNVFAVGPITGAVTLTLVNQKPGQVYCVDITQDATGGRAVTFSTGFTAIGGLVINTAPNGRTTIPLIGTTISAAEQLGAQSGGGSSGGIVALGSLAAGTHNINGALGNTFTATLAGAVTFTCSNLVAGQIYTIALTQDGTGGRVPVWDTGFLVANDWIAIDQRPGTSNQAISFIAVSTTSLVPLANPGTVNNTNGSTVIASPNTFNVALVPGYNTAAHTGGAAGNVHQDIVYDMGELGDVAPFIGLSSALEFEHTTIGTLLQYQLAGTAGSPDTNAIFRVNVTNVPLSFRIGTGGSYIAFTSTIAGGAFYFDHDTGSTGFTRWRDLSSGAVTNFEVTQANGVGLGATPPANTGNGGLYMLGRAAPTLTPAAGCGALWYDSTYQAVGVRDENSANNYFQETSTQADDGNTNGAYVMDVESRKFHKITATGNITAWTITGATPGEIVHLEFVQDGGGGRTLALGAGLSSPAGVTLTPNAAGGAMSFYIVVCLTATTGIVLPFRG